MRASNRQVCAPVSGMQRDDLVEGRKEDKLAWNFDSVRCCASAWRDRLCGSSQARIRLLTLLGLIWPSAEKPVSPRSPHHGMWFFPAVLLVGMLPWTVAPLFHWRSVMQTSASSLRSLGFVWFVVLIFFSLPPSKLVGYIFPSLPAFAIIVGPWFTIYRYRYAMTTIGGAICVGALLTATYIIPTGPIGQLKNSRSKLRPPMKSSLLVSICSTLLLFSTERLLSMSWMIGLGVRQIFQIQSGGNLPRPRVRAASAHVLIGEQELKAMLSEGRRMWIWTGSADLVPENGGLVPVASQGGYTVLRARH